MEAGTPVMETPTRSSGHTDQGITKKSKGFDGLVMSIGNSNSDSSDGGANHTQSQSVETETSSDRSNGNTAGVIHGRKRSHEKTPKLVSKNWMENGSVLKFAMPLLVSGKSDLVKQILVELVHRKVQKCTAREAWLQAFYAESLNADNMTLKSEISRLIEISEKLKLENALLMDKMKNGKGGQTDAVISLKVSEKRVLGNKMYEKNSKSGAKLHQLLDANPKADAVAAR